MPYPAKPPTTAGRALDRGHPLLSRAKLYVPMLARSGVPTDAISGARGVLGPGTVTPTWVSCPFGPALAYGNEAAQKPIIFPNRALGLSFNQITIYALWKLITTSASPRIVMTSSGDSGLGIEYESSQLALIIGSVANVYSGITLAAGHWTAVAISWRLYGTNKISFFVHDYVTGVTSTASVTSNDSYFLGDGHATIMNTSAGGGFANSVLALAGISSGVWNGAQFQRFVRDPFGPVRHPPSWLGSVLPAPPVVFEPPQPTEPISGLVEAALYWLYLPVEGEYVISVVPGGGYLRVRKTFVDQRRLYLKAGKYLVDTSGPSLVTSAYR